jgi:DNA mismatch repair protein MutS
MLERFGEQPPAQDHASGAILQYLDLTEHHQVKHISRYHASRKERYVWRQFTIRNLELFHPLRRGENLYRHHRQTISPMGARLMVVDHHAPEHPACEERLDAVETLIMGTGGAGTDRLYASVTWNV